MSDVGTESPTRSRSEGVTVARRVARNTGVQLGGDALSKLGSLAFYTVMARELGKSGFGNFTFAASVVLFIEVAALGTDLLVTRDVARDRARAAALFWDVNAIKLTLGAAGSAVAIAVSFAGGYGASVRGAVAILAVAKLFEIFAKTVHSVLRGIEDMAPIALSLMVQRFSTAAVGVVAMLAGAGLVAVALIYLGGAALALVYLLWSVRRRHIPLELELSPGRARALAIESLPIGLSWIFGAILARLDAVLLSFYKSSATVGLYGAAYRFFEVTLLLSSWFALAALPTLSRLGRHTTPSLGDAFGFGLKVVALVLCPISVGMIAFAGTIVTTIYGHGFAHAATALRLLGASTALDGAFILSVQVLAAQDRRRLLTPIGALVVAENAILNVLLIPHFSLNGAAAAMTASEATLSVLVLVYTLRVAGSVRWRRIALAPACGAAAMGAVAALLGDDIPAIALAGLAYAVVACVVERRIYPRDLALLADSVLPPGARVRVAALVTRPARQ